MNLPPDTQLSEELQEIYLQNKHWLADVEFLADETRFFRILFEKVLAGGVKEALFEEVRFVNLSLTDLETRREELRKLIISHQKMVGSIIANPGNPISIALIEENTANTKEILTLFSADRTLKSELFSLVENVLRGDKASHLPITEPAC